MLQIQELSSTKRPLWLVNARYTFGADRSCDFIVGGTLPLSAELNVRGDTLELVRHNAAPITVNGMPLNVSCVLNAEDKFEFGDDVFVVFDPKQRFHNVQQSPTEQSEALDWFLEAEDAGAEAQWIPLARTTVIGRAASCDIVLDFSKLSRRHARLSVDEKGVEVVDLASSNGTQVNGVKVERKRLNVGDQVCFDTLCYRVRRRGHVDPDIDKTNIRPALNWSSSQQAAGAPKLHGERLHAQELQAKKRERALVSMRGADDNTNKNKPKSLVPLLFGALFVAGFLLIIYLY